MSSEEIYRPLRVLHSALVFGALLILAIFLFVLRNPQELEFDLQGDPLIWVGIAITGVAMVASKWLQPPRLTKPIEAYSEDDLIQLRMQVGKRTGIGNRGVRNGSEFRDFHFATILVLGSETVQRLAVFSEFAAVAETERSFEAQLQRRLQK